MSMSALSKRFGQVMKQEAASNGNERNLKIVPGSSTKKARADFDHWSKMPRWTLEEATALSFGKAPEFVNWDKVKANRGQSSFADGYWKR